MSRRPVSARACAAALLAAAARRRLPGLPRIVLPRLAAAGDGVGAGGGAGSAQGLDGGIREPGLLERDDDPAESVLFLAAPSSQTLSSLICCPVRAVNAWRRWLMSCSVLASWVVSSGRNEASVANLSQVRQALPLLQCWRGGSRHQPLGKTRSARLSSWSMS